MENNNETNEKWSIGDFISIVIVILVVGAIGYGIGWYRYDSKLTEYEIKIEELNNELSQYTATEDMLLPCPWCGSDNVTFCENDFYGVYVKCLHCYAQSPSLREYDEDDDDIWKTEYEFETREEAMNSWNSLARQ